MKTFTIEISGKSHTDIVLAMEETLRLIQGGNLSGFNGNETGDFTFDSSGEYEDDEEDDETDIAWLPRLMLNFRPQAWVNDWAMDIDGQTEFDGTLAVLSLYDVERIARLDDGKGDNDDLIEFANIPEYRRHNGPFEVTADLGAVTDFFAENGFSEITEQSLTQMRVRYGIDD